MSSFTSDDFRSIPAPLIPGSEQLQHLQVHKATKLIDLARVPVVADSADVVGPIVGQVVYDENVSSISFYNGTVWKVVDLV